MSTKTFFKAVWAIVLLLNIQTGLAQEPNPTRTVLYTLGANERMNYNEYAIAATVTGEKFWMLTYDEDLDETQVVFNGVIIAKKRGKPIDFGEFDKHWHFDLSDENGYLVVFDGEDGKYINKRGEIKGPFEDATLFSGNYTYAYQIAGYWYVNNNDVIGGPYENVSNIYMSNGYAYQLAGIWYEKINDQITGPYTGGTPHANRGKYTETGEYAFCYGEYGNQYENINGTIFGPYEVAYSPSMTVNGNYAFEYRDNGKHYVNINGTIAGPYNSVYDSPRVTNSGEYAFNYYNNGKWYVNISGTIDGPYDNVRDLPNIIESGKYAFNYYNNGKWYININGTINGPYDDIKWSNPNIVESGQYTFNYYNNGKWYVNINGTIAGPYDNVYDTPSITNSGKYAFDYYNNGQYYANINGTIMGPYSNTDYVTIDDNGNYSFTARENGFDYLITNEGKSIILTESASSHFSADKVINSTDMKHSFVSTYAYEYVVIDGNSFGTAPALYVRYDKTKNAFIWLALEEKELVRYEYKLLYASKEIINQNFESDVTGWKVVNDSQANKWILGTATASSGTKSIYISNNNSSNVYTLSSSSITHAFYDVTFPDYNSGTLTFDWKGMGEILSGTIYDALKVYIVNTNESLSAGALLSATPLGTYNNSNVWQTATIAVPNYSGLTKRLVFTWENDNSLGTQPPIAIDNVRLTVSVLTTQTIHLDAAGTLKDHPGLSMVENLTITGNIDARDFQFMRDSMLVLEKLDLSKATVVAYDGTKGTRYGTQLGYPSNEIPFDAFYFADIQAGKTSLISIALPSRIAAIAGNAFRSCSGLSGQLVLPDDLLIFIGEYAFYNCTGLTGNLVFPDLLLFIGTNAFYNCTGLTGTLNLPSGLTTINNGAFYNCAGLSGSLTIPAHISSVGEWAFYNCTGFTSLSLPEGLTSVQNGAFEKCAGLKTISLPSTLTSISDYTFFQCTALELIVNRNPSPVVITADVFRDVNKNTCELRVPKNTISAYRNALVWQDFLSINEYEPSGIEQIDVNSVEIHPTRVKDGFTISGLPHSAILSIYTLLGQKAMEKQVFNEEFVPVADLPKGMYLVVVEIDNQRITKKIFK